MKHFKGFNAIVISAMFEKQVKCFQINQQFYYEIYLKVTPLVV